MSTPVLATTRLMTPEELSEIIRTTVRSEVGALVRESQKKPATMNEAQAAKYICRKPNTLRTWRSNSKGPHYIKDGNAILYRVEDLNAWLEKNKVITHG